MSPDELTVRTPATIGNFGPGFDVTSLAIDHGGDTVTARLLPESEEDRVTMSGAGAADIPSVWGENAAALGFHALRERLGQKRVRVHLEVHKGVPPGSGLGSSASSAAGGVLAAAKLLAPEKEWTPAGLLEAALAAESKVAGQHGDDVAAALMGGLAMVRRGECMRFDPPAGLALAIVQPEFSLSTRQMRALVPEEVPVKHAVANMANLGFLLAAWANGDARAVERSLGDHLVTPHRRRKIPFFDAVLEAARETGASTVAISGSGPALFTVTEGQKSAKALADAMTSAVRDSGVPAKAVACLPEHRHVWREALS